MEIQELVAAPISLSLETTIDGNKFYSSDTLKQKFVHAFEKSSKGKHVTKEIERLVEKGIVIPCYKSKNLLGFITKKLFSTSHDKYIMGFYHVYEKKVIILVENSVTIFGTAANNELVSTTMHECMHLSAGRNLSKFRQIFMNYLRAYYSEFLNDFFKIDIPTKSVDSLIKYLAVFERKGPGYVNKELGNYYRFLYSLVKEDSSLDDRGLEARLTMLVVALKLFIMHMPSFAKNIRRYSMLLTSLNNAYLKAFGKKNNYTTPIQELSSISEIACVVAEMRSQDPVIKKLFQIVS